MKKNEITQSTWTLDADYRIKNRKWLRYSSNIARRVLAILSDNDKLTQVELANKVGVTPQYISKLLQGRQNLTLSTIAKLSETLGEELISFPNYKYSTRYTGMIVSSDFDKYIMIPISSINNSVVFDSGLTFYPRMQSFVSNTTVKAEVYLK